MGRNARAGSIPAPSTNHKPNNIMKFILHTQKFTLKINALYDYVTIYDSYRIKSIKDMIEVISECKEYLEEHSTYYEEIVPALRDRSYFNLINEWRSHNLLYALGINRIKTTHVDFESNPKWYFNVIYFIGSLCYLKW